MLRNDHWLKGPMYLWEDESLWPKMIEVLVLRDIDVEVRKEAQVYVSTLQRNALDELTLYYSCWWESSSKGWCVDTAVEPAAKVRPVESWRSTSQCTPSR